MAYAHAEEIDGARLVQGVGRLADPPLDPEDGSEPAESDIWLEAGDLDPDGYAEISGFEPGRDVLNVVFEADHGLPDLDVSVQLSEAGDDTEVFVGGRLIAVLLAAPDVMADEIIVSVQGV